MPVTNREQPGDPVSIPEPLVLYRALTPLARLAAGKDGRWDYRRGRYSNDAGVIRVTEWYNWARQRIEVYIACRPPMDEKKAVYTWLTRKYRTLCKAATEVPTEVLPIDVADQVVRLDICGYIL